MLLIFVVLLWKSVCCGEMDYIPKDWIDPNDMRNYDRMTKTMKSTHTPTDYNSNSVSGSCDADRLDDSELREDNRRLEIFIERFINRLLQSANLKDHAMKPGMKMVTEIPFSITADELSKLTALAHGFKSANLTELDRLLSMILTYERGFTFDSMVSYLNPVQELFFNMSLEKLTIIMGIAVTSVTLWMFAIGNSIKRIMAFLYILCFVSGMAFNAWNLYMEAVSEQIAESKKYLNIPDVCDPKKSSWWSYFFSYKDECKEFHKTMRIDPLSRVVPSIIFSHTLSMMLVHPLKDIGIRCGDFLYGVSNAAPWPLNIIFLPFVLIMSCIVFTFIVIIKLGASLNCWTLLGGLSIGITKSKNEDNEANAALLNELQSLKRIIESDRKIQYSPESGDGKFNVAYHRSQSIASCSTQDCVNTQNNTSFLSNGNNVVYEENPTERLLNAVAYFKTNKKSFFGKTLSQKSLISKKKHK